MSKTALTMDKMRLKAFSYHLLKFFSELYRVGILSCSARKRIWRLAWMIAFRTMNGPQTYRTFASVHSIWHYVVLIMFSTFWFGCSIAMEVIVRSFGMVHCEIWCRLQNRLLKVKTKTFSLSESSFVTHWRQVSALDFCVCFCLTFYFISADRI